MAETKYTPGPWRVGKADEDNATLLDEHEVQPADIMHGGPVALVSGLIDAHLIAAAPDLYEALKRWKSVLTDWESVRIQATDIGADMAVSQLMMDTDAALAKARGETDG